MLAAHVAYELLFARVRVPVSLVLLVRSHLLFTEFTGELELLVICKVNDCGSGKRMNMWLYLMCAYLSREPWSV